MRGFLTLLDLAAMEVISRKQHEVPELKNADRFLPQNTRDTARSMTWNFSFLVGTSGEISQRKNYSQPLLKKTRISHGSLEPKISRYAWEQTEKSSSTKHLLKGRTLLNGKLPPPRKIRTILHSLSTTNKAVKRLFRTLVLFSLLYTMPIARTRVHTTGKIPTVINAKEH